MPDDTPADTFPITPGFIFAEPLEDPIQAEQRALAEWARKESGAYLAGSLTAIAEHFAGNPRLTAILFESARRMYPATHLPDAAPAVDDAERLRATLAEIDHLWAIVRGAQDDATSGRPATDSIVQIAAASDRIDAALQGLRA